MTWQEIVDRWKSPTPRFWKNVKKKGLYLGSLGTAAGTVQAQFPQLHIPEIIFTLSTHLAVVGFVMVLLAKLTCDDSEGAFIADEEIAKRRGKDSVG